MPPGTRPERPAGRSTDDPAATADPVGPDDGSILTPDVDPTARATPAEPGTPAPDIETTASALAGQPARSTALTILAVLALLYTLYFARAFLLPIVFAVLLDFLLSPIVRTLARIRIPPPVSAGLIILAIVGVLASGTFGLAGAVRDWAAAAPQTLKKAEDRLSGLIRPIQSASKTAEQVAHAATDVASATDSAEPAAVVVQGPSFASRAFGTTQRSLAGMLEVLVLLYFLLAAGDLFLQKLIKVLPNLGEKRKAVEIARATEASISTYLLTATAVNVGEGIVVGVVMYFLGMPNPALWGALVVLLEFIPYLGALAMVLILSVAALTTFDSIGHALLVPASFLLINVIQSNLVSPLLLGHRLALNPVALFVGLAFWFWIWGIPGAFIAVPILATFKIFCDHIESLAAVGEFLGKRDDRERRLTIRSLRSG
jgi:predicted PurR-regulated permease PerM